jgi:pyruvate/2-oxoglutarate dehydrogenase complex dihydrolipoamide dehydrogenase (E3) component
VVVIQPDGGERRLTARQAIVLDTGSTPFIPAVPGLREAMPWTSRDVTNMHDVPARVVVLGDSVVACEAATWLHGLGVSQVTVVHRGQRLLAKNEPFVSDLIEGTFRKSGIAVRLGTSATSVRRADVYEAGVGHVHGGELTVSLSDGDTVTADEIVVATGRTSNSEGIGLDTVGLNAGGPVTVDDHMTVTGVAGGWLYAIGDLCGRALLTHMGKYQARIAGRVIARPAGRSATGRSAPTSTSPITAWAAGDLH